MVDAGERSVLGA